MVSEARPEIRSILGVFRCADGHAEVLHGEGPFGCPVCAVTAKHDELESLRVQVREYASEIEDLEADKVHFEDEAFDLHGEIDALQDEIKTLTARLG